jgi:nicotinamidase-related amidase
LALVVYDMQVGVLGQLPDAEAVVARVVEVLATARAGGYPIFFLRHMFLPNRLKGTFGLRMAMAWQHVGSPAQRQDFLLRDSPEFALVPELSPRADEAILDKTTMSAFEGTPLEPARHCCADRPPYGRPVAGPPGQALRERDRLVAI